NGPIDAAVNALGGGLRIDDYVEHAIGGGSDAQAMAIVEAAAPGVAGTRFGAGRDANTITASIVAVVGAARRLGVRPVATEQTAATGTEGGRWRRALPGARPRPGGAFGRRRRLERRAGRAASGGLGRPRAAPPRASGVFAAGGAASGVRRRVLMPGRSA